MDYQRVFSLGAGRQYPSGVPPRPLPVLHMEAGRLNPIRLPYAVQQTKGENTEVPITARLHGTMGTGIIKQIQAFIKLKIQASSFYNITQSMCEQPLHGFIEVPKGLEGSYRVHKLGVPNGPAFLQNPA